MKKLTMVYVQNNLILGYISLIIYLALNFYAIYQFSPWHQFHPWLFDIRIRQRRLDQDRSQS